MNQTIHPVNFVIYDCFLAPPVRYGRR